jgi:hypothetical protein
MSFAAKILGFYQRLDLGTTLPEGIEAMNPYRDETAFSLCHQFYTKFYDDAQPRSLILGINPGRFGGGITGIPFTDPIKLKEYCEIDNDLKKKAELSADFIYAMINGFGGPSAFYKRFYISALSPLGFVKDGKNLNYYDSKALIKAVEPFMIDSIKTQLEFGIRREVCFCLGEGENYRYLQKLNNEHQFFEHIEPLSHPRFIMQYKRKHIPHYIKEYVTKLKAV